MNVHADPGPVLEMIPARGSIVGDAMTVSRALPNKQRRMVGAWCFLDHAGPMDYAEGQGLAVGPHPHIGLQTFTWMIEGEVDHHDSLGNHQRIRPGQVNLMTAGHGISHAEVSTAEPGRIHAAQLWIALPDADRHREPAFEHFPDLPKIDRNGFTVTLLVGEALGAASPVPAFSPLLGMDLQSADAAHTRLPLRADFEHAVVCLQGAVSVEGQRVVPGEMLYLGTDRTQVEIECTEAAHLLLVGGTPFDEDILLWWNFVARTREEMIEATRDWNEGDRFGTVSATTLPRLHAPDPSTLNLRAG